MPDNARTVPVTFQLGPQTATALEDPATRARVERLILLCHKLRWCLWCWQHGHRGMLRAMARAIATRTDVIEFGT